MNYHILYDRQFIKASDNLYCPIYLGGDNNCYENSGRNAKRSRSWCNSPYISNGKLLCTIEDIETALEKQRLNLIENKEFD
jgi:hypothetical protein